MSVITIFDYFKKTKSCLPLINILLQIKTGKYRSQIERLRKFREEGIGDNYDQQKKVIPLFSVAGNFKTEKDKLRMVSYSGNLLLEISYLNQRDFKTVKMLVANDPYVMACFENALGNGLVFIVRSNGVVEEHGMLFNLALKYYKGLTGVNHFSKEGKSIFHICMVSFDEHIYIGMEAKSFSEFIKSKML